MPQPIRQFPQHEENPFLLETYGYLKEIPRYKRVTSQPSGEYIDRESGEMIEVFDVKTNHALVDGQPFLKAYYYNATSFLEELVDMPKYAQKVLLFILKCVERDKDVLYFSPKECQKYTKHPSMQSVYNGLSYLLEHQFIARSELEYKYFLNPVRVFNGNRVKIVARHISKLPKNLTASEDSSE